MANRINDISCLRAKAVPNYKMVPLLVLLLLFGCGGPSDEEIVSPNGEPGGTFYSLAVLKRFEPGFTAETARGKELYLKNCVVCHGVSGDGKGFNAYNLKSNFGVEPFDFTDASAQIPFDEVKKAIAYGGPAVNKSQYMPPWGATFIEYDLACIATYAWHRLMKR
jgi:mono/diheme cytochrome c family protein